VINVTITPTTFEYEIFQGRFTAVSIGGTNHNKRLIPKFIYSIFSSQHELLSLLKQPTDEKRRAI